jgi:hypothetical protein
LEVNSGGDVVGGDGGGGGGNVAVRRDGGAVDRVGSIDPYLVRFDLG